MTHTEIAEIFDDLAKLCREADRPPLPPPTTVEQAVALRGAILGLAEGGVKALQRALGVEADGIIGPLTRAALDAAVTEKLLDALKSPPITPPPKGRTQYTAELAAEYHSLYVEAIVRPERMKAVSNIASQIKINAPVYRTVTDKTGIPEIVIGIIHSLECGLSFRKHLHNGDPLARRTVNVPVGRPLAPPPWTWEESAIDALLLKDLDTWLDWSNEGVAFVLESYNGFGYRLYRPGVNSPYLWSFTTAYGPPEAKGGKYVADHTWDPNAVSEQCGGMALLKLLRNEAGS